MIAPLEWLVEPIAQYQFMRAGLAAAILVGVVCAVLSCLLVVRGQALLGDAIAHAVLLGVVLGYLVGREAGILWGALAVAVATGVGITAIERHSAVKRDAAMGILFTFAFALGLAILSIAQPRGIDLFHVLFGNVLGVSPRDLALTAVASTIVVAVVGVWFRVFHLWSFDPTLARSLGVPVGVIDYLFVALLSATVVASLQTVGLILVVAMLITPGAAGLVLTSTLLRMMGVAVVVSLAASIGGLYTSFYLDVASGPAMVIIATVCFGAALLVARRRDHRPRRAAEAAVGH